MTGCVFKRKLPSGKISWGYSVDAGRDDNGKRQQIQKTGFARKLDADFALAKVLNERNEGTVLRPDPRTFAEFSREWLADYAEVKCAPKTAERYREMLAHVTRAIGNSLCRRSQLCSFSVFTTDCSSREKRTGVRSR
jgi:hypothetical protein